MKTSSRVVTLEDVRTGGVYRQMLRLGWPIASAGILDLIYQFVDTLWLGRLPPGEAGDAVAGLQIIFPFVWFASAITIGFSLAGTSMVSQFTGAGLRKKADLAVGQVISLATISSLVIAVAGQIVVPFLMPFVTDIESLTLAANAYLKVYFLGLPFMFITSVCRSMFAASGNSITPLKIVFFGNMINIALNSLLVFGAGPIPALGIHGCALATVIAMGFTAVSSLVLLARKDREIRITWPAVIPRLSWCKKIVRIGLPATVGSSAESFGFILLLLMIGKVEGARDALGGFGMSLRIINVGMLIMMGLSMGLTVIIGQFLGAGDISGAEKTIRKGIMGLTMLLLFEMGLTVLFRVPLLALFIPNEPGMVWEGARCLFFLGISAPCYGVITGVSSAFNAAGNNTPVMLISIIRLWILRLPMCYGFAFMFNLGAIGIWYGLGLSNFAIVGVAVYFYLKGGWKRGLETITPD